MNKIPAQQYQRIFLLSHMCAYSSLIGHILVCGVIYRDQSLQVIVLKRVLYGIGMRGKCRKRIPVLVNTQT